MGWLVDNAVEREELVQVLREITDLERLISRIVYGTAGARDLVALAAGLDRLPLLQDHLPQQAPSLLARLQMCIRDSTLSLRCCGVLHRPDPVQRNRRQGICGEGGEAGTRKIP